MPITAFHDLLKRIHPYIVKEDTQLRESISPGARLEATLRFLAAGGSYASLQYSTRISKQSLCLIIPETCEAIYNKFLILYSRLFAFHRQGCCFKRSMKARVAALVHSKVVLPLSAIFRAGERSQRAREIRPPRPMARATLPRAVNWAGPSTPRSPKITPMTTLPQHGEQHDTRHGARHRA